MMSMANPYGTSAGPTPVEPETPFDSIESSHRYLSLLAEAIEEACAGLREEIDVAVAQGESRREEALRLAAFKLSRLAEHIGASRVILNDLRTLRRLLLGERGLPAEPGADPEPPAEEIEEA
jgi:hypothetical protein